MFQQNMNLNYNSTNKVKTLEKVGFGTIIMIVKCGQKSTNILTNKKI